MTFIEIFDAFTFYGIDVVLLATLTAAVTQLLKKTVLKRVQKKILTFLPFALGTLFYAVYAAVRNLSFCYLVCNYVSVIEHGVSVGAAATLVYVMYEQFVRDKKSTSQTEQLVATLIEGYVPDEHIEAAAKAVTEAIERDVTGNGALRAEEIILSYGGEDLSEKDVKLLARLIIETLAHVTTV